MAWYDIFTGGLTGVIGEVANELIDTPLEKAQAQALKVKAMDPNGKLRRDITRFACRAYGFYLGAMVIMGFMHIFGVGDPDGAKEAIEFLSGLFLPITTSWGVIVSASFGVNYKNTAMGAP